MKKLIATGLVVAAALAHADTCYWKGGYSNKWTDAQNWDDDKVAGTGDDVVIKADAVRGGLADYGDIWHNANRTVRNFTILKKGFRFYGDGVTRKLTITGDLTVGDPENPDTEAESYLSNVSFEFPAGNHTVFLGKTSSGQDGSLRFGAVNNSVLIGSGALTKTGPGALVVYYKAGRSIPFSGTLRIEEGTVQFYSAGLPSIQSIEATGATSVIGLNSGTDTLNPNVVLKLANGGRYSAGTSASVHQTIRQFWLDGTQRSSGVWTGTITTAGADHYAPDNIIGPKSTVLIEVTEGAGCPGGVEEGRVCKYLGTSSQGKNWQYADNWLNGVMPTYPMDTIVVSNAHEATDTYMTADCASSGIQMKDLVLAGGGGYIYCYAAGAFTISGDIRKTATSTKDYGIGYFSTMTFSEGTHEINVAGKSILSIPPSCKIAGSGKLVKKGPNTLQFPKGSTQTSSDICSFTGDIVVNEGIWQFLQYREFPNVTNVTVSGSTAQITVAGNRNLSENADITVGDGGNLAIQVGVTNTCRTLTIDGVSLRKGIYGGPDSVAPKKVARGLSGGGVVNVTVGAPKQGLYILVR